MSLSEQVMANNSMVSKCIAPLLPEANYPSTGGDIAARFCATFAPGGPSCCLPCPTSSLLFDDNFSWRVRLASYISIASLICNTFLLATFVLLPREKSHRHYLSIGLTSSFILIAIAFIIPLGTKPDHCYNDITPHTEKTQASCAATGVLVELGAMGAVVWILLRSIWTLLRITINLKNVEIFKKIAITIGILIPLLFLAISLPITGVSYSLSDVCVPANPNGLQTWFAWILVFTIISDVIMIGTMLYVLYRFAIFSFTTGTATSTSAHSASTSITSNDITGEAATDNVSPRTPIASGKKPPSPRRRKHILWSRAKSILALQWRSIVLAFIVANLAIFFGMFFINETDSSRFQYALGSPRLTPNEADFQWISCLIANGGDKEECLHGSTEGVGLRETRVEASLIVASLIGIIVFLLMVRTSMFVGWRQLLRDPGQVFRRPSVDNEDLLAQGGTRVEPPFIDVDQKEAESGRAEQGPGFDFHQGEEREEDLIV